MLKPGTLVGDSLESGSMARAIEDAMVAQGVLVLDDETPDAAENRRKAFIAIATGVITHIKANLDIAVAVNKFGTVPTVATSIRGTNGEIS